MTSKAGVREGSRFAEAFSVVVRPNLRRTIGFGSNLSAAESSGSFHTRPLDYDDLPDPWESLNTTRVK